MPAVRRPPNQPAAAPATADGTKLRPIPALDGVRAVAVTAVVVHHVIAVFVRQPLESPADDAVRGGFLGVDVFFVLSGMLITSLLVREFDARRTIALGRFIWHRMLRLIPALWVMLACSTIWAKANDQSMTTQWKSVRAAVLYVSNWTWRWDGLDGVRSLGHLWSLSVEFQFYLVWPFVVFGALAIDRKGRLLTAIAALGVVFVVWWRLHLRAGGDNDLFLYQRTDTRMDALMIGALLAIVWWKRPRYLAPLRWAAWPAAALVLFAFVRVGFDPWLFRWGFTAFAVLVAVVLGGILSGSWPGERGLAVLPLVALGRVSYGVYLWHFPVFYAVLRSEHDRSTTAQIAIALLLTAVCTLASWYLVEQPIRRLRNLGRPPSSSSPGSTPPPRRGTDPEPERRPLRPATAQPAPK